MISLIEEMHLIYIVYYYSYMNELKICFEVYYTFWILDVLSTRARIRKKIQGKDNK